MQIRSVECVDIHGAHNTQCDPNTRPAAVQSCSTGISCTSEAPATDSEEALSSDNPNEVNLNENIAPADDVTEEDEESENVGQQKSAKASSKSMPDDIDEETEEDDDDMQGDDPRERNRQIPLAYQYRIPRAERLVDPNAPNEPT